MIQVVFGLHLDDRYYPLVEEGVQGQHKVGPQGLLLLLERYLGLVSNTDNIEHLRIEQFRQAMLLHSAKHPDAFYSNSFKADEFAAANRLLEWRDELIGSGWNFDLADDLPPRLQTLAELENILQQELELKAGVADRYEQVIANVNSEQITFEKILHIEPISLLPPQLQRLVGSLKEVGVNFEKVAHQLKSKTNNATANAQLSISFDITTEENEDKNDLRSFQDQIKGNKNRTKKTLAGDGSLLILRSKRETDAAVYLAKLFKANVTLQPLCLIPEKNRALDNAFIQEGLPSLGILSASLARPSLQILKLVSSFLWKPIDPTKILEFITLTIKPLAKDLSFQLAAILAQKPGIHNDSWFITKTRYFEHLKEKAQKDSSIDYKEIEAQYQFWFDRPRYDSGKSVPKKDVIEIFGFLQKWASRQFEDSQEKNNALLVLSGQARRVKDLLETIPEDQNQLTFLELERVVRTIYEPSPVEFQPSQVGHLPYVHKNGAIISSSPQLLWWNFIRNEPQHFFSKWYQDELAYFDQKQIKIQSPIDANEILLYHRNRPALLAAHQLILIIPENVDGSAVHPHALHDEMEATFQNLEAISFNIDEEQDRKALSKYFATPAFHKFTTSQPGYSRHLIKVSNPDKLRAEDQETFTSLESLFYYPYQWVFRHKIKLRKSSILSVIPDVTLKGNLSHRFFELILAEDFSSWTKQQVNEWIDDRSYNLLSKEGAVLLMYGREPDKVAFINTVKNAVWTLISLIKSNGWKVRETEMNLEGEFMNLKIIGKADLVLERGDELAVVDLKWRGATRRKNMIKNEEDLQLITYSKLVGDKNTWAHTAYFIIEDAVIIARDNKAFKEVITDTESESIAIVNERIWKKMEATYQWRMAQFENGEIEIRTEKTFGELEELYAGQLMDLLEMRDKDAPFDDYDTLIKELG